MSRFVFAALLVASAGSAAAQAPPVFSQQVDLVSVDVLVLDERGRPVGDLEAGDFTVKEEGKVQTLRTFQAVSFTEAPQTTALDSVVSTSRVEAARVADRSFLVVIDDVHLTHLGAVRAKREIGRLLDTLRPGDRITLVPTSENTWWTARLPEGRDDLVAFLDRLEGQRPTSLNAARQSDWEAMQIHYGRDPSVLGVVARRYYENGRLQEVVPADRGSLRNDLELTPGLPLIRAEAAQVYDAATQRMTRSLDVMERAVLALGVVPGRKAVLVVSEGFVHDGTRPQFRQLLRAAREANAVLYFFDARGQAGPAMPGNDAEFGNAIEERDRVTTMQAFSHEAEGTESMALDTGGRVVSGTDDLAGAMARVIDESRAYYLLGYVPERVKRDGKFRSLEVKVARSGVTVRARRGYYAPDDKEPKPPEKDTLDPRVRAGLVSPFVQDALPLRLASYVLGWNPNGAGGVLLAADVDVSGVAFHAQGGREVGVVETYLVVTPRGGGEIRRQEKRLDLALPADVLARLRQTGLPLLRDLELPPGAYQARLLVRDPKSGAVGTVQHTFTVPPPQGLRVSTPVLTDTLEGDRPVPLARRVFPPGGHLVYAFEVFGATDVRVAYSVRAAGGAVVAEAPPRPLAPGTDGSLAARLELPLATLPPGDYEVRLTVEDPAHAHRLERQDPFTVGSPAGR